MITSATPSLDRTPNEIWFCTSTDDKYCILNHSNMKSLQKATETSSRDLNSSLF